MTKDPFEKRRHVTQRFRGVIRCNTMDQNYRDLINDGYTIRVFVNDRERPNWTMADPEKGIVETANAVTYNGNVEIRLSRPERK